MSSPDSVPPRSGAIGDRASSLRESVSAVDARSRLSRLQEERLNAVEAGLGANSIYMADLQDDILAARAAYVGLAMTEVATLRAELGGAQVG